MDTKMENLLSKIEQLHALDDDTAKEFICYLLGRISVVDVEFIALKSSFEYFYSEFVKSSEE